MSHQTSMVKYFKSKTNRLPYSLVMDDKIVKKRPRVNDTSSPSTKIIDLCSDDDIHVSPTPDEPENLFSTLDSFLNQSSQCKIVTFPHTPQKSSPASQSPSPRSKFYSPTKKRMVSKRNLFIESFESVPSTNLVEDEAFTNACEGMDDKSIFLLTIINRYLKDESLKHLLDKDSQELLMKCMHIVKPGMRLACRLFWCQPRWYRKDKLLSIADKNMDDSRFYLMINSLIDSGLMIPAQMANKSSLSLDDCTSLLKCDEIKKICQHLKLKVQSKQDAINALNRFSKTKTIAIYFSGNDSNNSGRVLQMVREKVGPCFKLSPKAQSTFHNLHILMYLGMNYSMLRDKKLEFMLLNDKTNMERYPIDKKMIVDNASVVFKNQEEFTRYLIAHDLYESFLAETKLDNKCSIVLRVFKLYKDIKEDDMMHYKDLPTWLRRFTPSHMYVKILEAGIQELKKKKSKESNTKAVDILTTLISQNAFRQHKKALWYTEKSLILHNLADCEEEAGLLIEGLQSDLSDEAKDAIRPRALLVAKRKNIDLDDVIRTTLIQYAEKYNILKKKLNGEYVFKQPMDNCKRGKQKFKTHTKDGEVQYLEAEEYCISYYVNDKKQFTHGQHWEGKIVTTIFFLLFWDIVYTKPFGVKGIFLSHYQLYPLDMFCESFYKNRKTLIDERLEKIKQCSDQEVLNIMRQKWDERPECELSGIVRSIGWDNVAMVSACLKASGVAALCRRLARDYSYTHTGFPDLTLWNTHTNKIKFVEVKTDADKPSVKQLQWMNYLQENGIDTGFCYLGVKDKTIV